VKATFALGRIGGVQVGAHWTVGVIVALATWALAAVVLPAQAPGQATPAYVAAGIVGAVGLMASILAHEASHVLVARRQGVPVRSITLWMLGGIAELGGHARSPRSELRIAVAGPLTSLAIAVGSYALAVTASVLAAPELIVTTLAWLAVVNFVVASFNLLPGAPLDGGRVLCAVLFAASGSGDGLWLALLGWFVLSSAKAEQTAAEMTTAFGDLRVGDVMTVDVEVADGSVTVADFVQRSLGRTLVSTFPLVDPHGRPVGVVTLGQLRRVPREAWCTTMLQEVATPAAHMTVAHPADRLVDVLAGATSRDGRIVVVDDAGCLVGLVTPRDVTTAFERRSLTGHGLPR
jgi:Zn-dependent protease